MVYIKGGYVYLEPVEGFTDSISDEKYMLYASDRTSYKIEGGKFAALKTEAELKAEQLRRRREKECFPIVNRGGLWYEKLTAEQRAELSAWYESWLNAPQTLSAPAAPDWLG